MKNKKGFTLIELLAVIVILAIIALIATPIVLNMINSARKKAAESSAYGFIDAIEYNNGFAQTEQEGYSEINGTNLDATSINVKMKGNKPTSGTVTIENGKVTSSNLCVEGYTVVYNGREVTSTTKGCSDSTPSSPYVYTTNMITNASDGSLSKPAGAHMYYRYELTDGEIAPGTEQEYCIYSDVINDELCLKDGEFETSLQKLKTYFGYDETTWNKSEEIDPEDSNIVYEYWSKPSTDIACTIYKDNGSLTRVSCFDNKNFQSNGNPNIGADVRLDGKIRTIVYEHKNGSFVKYVTSSR